MQICIDGISISTIIGCYEVERTTPQELILNLILNIENQTQINNTDELENTVDYDAIIHFVKNIVVNTNYRLLEKLALEINNKILENYLIITKSTVEIIKPAICGLLAREIKVVHTKTRNYNIALALGSNATQLPKQQIITAIEMLAEYINDIKISKLYKTKPYGYHVQNDFYNAVITGNTVLKPQLLLAKIKKIEKLLGKIEERINGPRVIDIDIIYFDNLVYAENFLVIPHKYMHYRDFVLRPLADLNPTWVHPILNKNIQTLLNELANESLTVINIEEYVSNAN